MPLVDKICSPAVPDLPTASWTNAYRIGHEVVLSGMTAHPASRDAAQQGAPLDAYAQTLVVLRKLEALVQAAGGHRHTPCSTLVAVRGLVFPELCVEVDAWARLDVDLRQAVPLAAV